MSFTATRAGDLPYRVVGNQKKTITDIALSTSYPVAGEPVLASDLGLNYVEHAQASLKTSATTTVNIANAHWGANKLIVFDETPAAVADAADLSGAVVRVVAYGH